ncbi:acyl-CoA N-acyltransferase [Cryomyces antarcticus]|nr:hypothetical protein LTR04_001754 [Oleoguttula sp. CCFEE 6159]
MLQTSIAAWLDKPRAVREPPQSIPLSPRRDPPATIDTGRATPSHHSKSIRPRPTASSEPSVPPSINFEPCTDASLSSFRRLNALLLPIPYPSKFYDEIITDPITASLTLLAVWRDQDDVTQQAIDRRRVVGGIRCRLLRNPHDVTDTLYISTICILSSYRAYGIATQLLQTVIARAVERYNVTAVTAHVWEANAEALAWYKKRGFAVEAKEEGYYRRLRPQTALFVRRRVSVTDLLWRVSKQEEVKPAR